MQLEIPSSASKISVQMLLPVSSINGTIYPFMWVPLALHMYFYYCIYC